MSLFTLDRLKSIGRDGERGRPGYLFGGHVRTSTVVLVIAFLGLLWVYESNERSGQSPSPPTQTPEVVPPGFIPDPNYTWVPRTRVRQPTQSPTPTPTTTAPPSTTTTTTPPPLFPPIVLPPPFGPPPSSATSPAPPAPGPAPPPFPQIVLPPPFGPPPSPAPGG
jgi:hypothetical protein